MVASNPGGAWAGLAGQVVRYADGVWTGAVPRAGWFAYLIDEADLYVFDGAAWTSFRRTLTAIQSVEPPRDQHGCGRHATASPSSRMPRC